MHPRPAPATCLLPGQRALVSLERMSGHTLPRAGAPGTAPIDAGGQHIRHRLSRAGNRRLNHVLYMAGFVQLRRDTQGRRYYRRRLADGKTPMEAMRCLRRRLCTQ